jgi:hypothetical protein
MPMHQWRRELTSAPQGRAHCSFYPHRDCPIVLRSDSANTIHICVSWIEWNHSFWSCCVQLVPTSVYASRPIGDVCTVLLFSSVHTISFVSEPSDEYHLICLRTYRLVSYPQPIDDISRSVIYSKTDVLRNSISGEWMVMSNEINTFQKCKNRKIIFSSPCLFRNHRKPVGYRLTLIYIIKL